MVRQGERKMKNINWNEQLKNRIISGGLSIVLVATGYCFGKSNTNEVVSQALEDYTLQQEALEKEIEVLLNQKEELLIEQEKLQNTELFNLSNLVVIEALDENNQSNLYICEGEFDSPFIREYKHSFSAIYVNSNYEWATKVFPEYIQVDNYKGLFSYLTDEELQVVIENKGMITNFDLDEILIRIRNDYKDNGSKKIRNKIN